MERGHANAEKFGGKEVIAVKYLAFLQKDINTRCNILGSSLQIHIFVVKDPS